MLLYRQYTITLFEEKDTSYNKSLTYDRLMITTFTLAIGIELISIIKLLCFCLVTFIA